MTFVWLQALGQVGRVVNVFPSGDVRVKVNGKTWTFNPRCMEAAPGETPLGKGLMIGVCGKGSTCCFCFISLFWGVHEQ